MLSIFRVTLFPSGEPTTISLTLVMSRRQMMTATTKVIAVALNYHKLHYIHSPSERMKA